MEICTSAADRSKGQVQFFFEGSVMKCAAPLLILQTTKKIRMEATKPTPTVRNISPLFNRILYIAFVLLAMYYALFSPDKMQGVSMLGIALIFDPFDQQVAFGKRPLWQRVWLLLHVAVLFCLFVWQVNK